jgi:hypothetical protein
MNHAGDLEREPMVLFCRPRGVAVANRRLAGRWPFLTVPGPGVLALAQVFHKPLCLRTTKT